MFQELNPPCGRTNVRRLSVYLAVLTLLLLTIAVPVAGAQTACNVIYTISPQNTSAFGASITINNTGTTAWASWTLTWTFANGQTVSQLWNGIETQSGTAVTVKNEPYNGSVAAGGSVQSIGFNGTWSGTTNAVPTSFAVNGTTCGGAAGSFTLKPSATALSIAQGTSGTDTITVADVSPFVGSVTLVASALPSGVTAVFATNPATSTSVIAFTASAAAAVGSSTVTITGTSGSLTATTAIALTISAKPGFTLTPVAASETLAQSASVIDAITVADAGGFTGTVTLTATSSNAGVTVTASGTTLTLKASSTATGTATITVTGTSGSTTAITTIAVTVSSSTGSFTIKPSATALSIAQGATGTDTITVTDTAPFAGSVTLSASGLPTGVTATFGTNPTATSSVLTLTVASAATAATTTITIGGTSGTLNASTTISLTITATATANAIVTVNPSNTGISVTDLLLGMNMGAWYDIVTNKTAIVDAFQTAGIKAVRWPGGSWSDAYHWATNTNCDVAPFATSFGQPVANDVFSNFVGDLAVPAGLDVALTANYGTNAACNGGGVPSEAAAWAAAALTDGITVSHMTVGNEVYGSTWEEDLHSPANNAATYAAAVTGASGYYKLIKAASPNTLVGVVVDADNTSGGWDNTVLANAKGFYDFVEYHYYAEAPGTENDSTLINQDAQVLTTNINTVKSELSEWGTAGTPIYVGEMGSVYSSPGKQTMSITQALYAGQTLGEMMNDGVSRATWWIGFGGCADSTFGANFSSSLYGWQTFGGYMIFSDGLPDGYQCTGETLAAGTLLPTSRAFQLFSQVLVNGEHVLTPSVTGDTADVIAYSATHSGGTALALFNRNENSSETVQIDVTGKTSSTSVTETTYNKTLYDESESGVWAAPTITNLGAQSLPLSLTLAPWSINIVIIN